MPPENSETSQIDGIAIYGDHIPVYLSHQELDSLKLGTPVTLPLLSHPGFQEIRISVLTEPNGGIGRTSIDGTAMILSICPTSISSYKNEINVELLGGHRNYVLRIEGWTNDYSDWEFAVMQARKKLQSILDNKS